jgi:uncharacterized protein
MTLERVVAFLARRRAELFALAVALLIAGLALTTLPAFSGSLRGFDVRENEFHATQLRADSLFGGAATLYLTITPTSTDLREVLSGLTTLEERIAAAYPDASIVSLSRYHRLAFGAGAPAASIDAFLNSVARAPLLRDLVGRDRTSFLLLVQVNRAAFDLQRFTAAIAGDYPGIAPPEALSLFHIEASIREHIVRDFVVLTLSVVLVFILLFAYIYRRAGAVIFAFANIVVAVLASLFFTSLFRVDLNLVTILVVPVVIVLSLADSIHLLTGYATSTIEDRLDRLKHVLSLYLIPSFYSSLTTAVAFFTFYLYSDAEFIRDFGLITALALLAEFFVTFMVSPLLLHAFDLREIHGFRVTRVSDYLIQRRRAFSLFFLATLFAGALFVPRLEFGTSTDIFFPRGSAVETAHARFNAQYYSQIDLQILVSGQDGGGDVEAARERLTAYVQELIEALDAQPEVTSVTSALDRISLPSAVPLLIPVSRLFAEGNPYYSETANVHRLVLTFPDPDRIKDFYTGTFSRLRQEAPANVSLAATSTVLLMDAVNEHVAGALVRSLLTAGLAIALMILIMTRSAPLALLCLLPNLVPLAIVTLIFVVFGFDINILTAITAVVCLGLLDDDTIHILYRKVALRRPLDEVSFSILSTSLILVIGFAIFSLSSFRPVQTFGTISAIVFLFGVASDLTLMPAVIDRWFAFSDGEGKT